MIYSPFKNAFANIDLPDLESLINNEINEGWYIEYKREIPKAGGKLDNVKIAKSLAAFANTKGGWIFWGIECDGNNKPVSIEGVDLADHRNIDDQLSQSINANISPVPIYHVKKIAAQNGKFIIVIKVDEGPTPPYITSQGVIYQREHNESKPIKDRYVIEKLNEKTKNYNESIERFSEFDLSETRGQSNDNQSYLELYLFPLPFDSFSFENFTTSEFFKSVAKRFYQKVDVNLIEANQTTETPLNLAFNSIYSSVESLIIRPLYEDNLIYKSTTVEMFDNANLKFLVPLPEFNSKNAPDHYANSTTLEYLLDKYSPFEMIPNVSYSPRPHLNIDFDLPPIKQRQDTDFVQHIKFIDGADLILIMLMVISKYREVLKDNKFDFDTKIGFRARLTNCWRKFVFFDNDDYLEKLKLYNIPLSPKNEIEIPQFKSGNSYNLKIDDMTFLDISAFVLQGIGLPDAASINFSQILKTALARFNANK